MYESKGFLIKELLQNLELTKNTAIFQVYCSSYYYLGTSDALTLQRQSYCFPLGGGTTALPRSFPLSLRPIAFSILPRITLFGIPRPAS